MRSPACRGLSVTFAVELTLLPSAVVVENLTVCRVPVRAVAPVPKPVQLAAIKAEPALDGIALVRQSRLSVMPVSPEHWATLCRMGGWPDGRGKEDAAA